MEQTPSIQWIENRRARTTTNSPTVDSILPEGVFEQARTFHNQIPGYQPSPLKSLPHLADMLGIGGIWVKDESARLMLNSFKVLGGSFAIYRFIKARLGLEDEDLSFDDLMSDAVREQLGDIVFTTATDGNHGRGVAWAANKLGCRAVIYVHKDTSQARIKAIENVGATVIVVNGTYDDAVRRANADAQENGWQVISDTSWPGYQDIPMWVMQGYATLLSEAREQLAAAGIDRPTHVIVQGGVGALAASTIGYFRQQYGTEQPIAVVVEPVTAACLYKSAKIGDGEPHSVDGDLQTIMAGLACGEPSPIAWKILWDCADAFVACPDYVAAKGMRVYAVPLKGDPFVVSGESGAVTLGALMFMMENPQFAGLKEALNLGPDSQVLLINTEGNTDPDYFRRVVWEGVEAVPEAFRWSESG